MASGQQLHDGVGANVTGTAGHEESLFFHGRYFSRSPGPQQAGRTPDKGYRGYRTDLDDTARNMP